MLISGVLYSSTISITTNTVQITEISNNSTFKPFFNITLLGSKSLAPNILKIELLELIQNDLENIGIGVDIDISGFDESDFDIFVTGFMSEPFVWDPYGPWQILGDLMCLEEYNELRDTHRDELNETKRSSIVKEIQALMFDNANFIVLCRHSVLWVFNDSWDLSHEDLMAIRTTNMRSGWAEFNFADVDPLIIGRPFVRTPDHLALYTEEPYYWMDIFCGSRYPSLIWQGLYERNRTNNFNWTPLLAKSMPKWSDDNKTATVELRDDVFFADGHPLTSHDVVETYRMHLTPGYHSWSYDCLVEHFDSNESISAIDNLTVQFNLTKPYPHALSYFHYGIFPVHIWGNHTHPTVADYEFDVELLTDISTTGKSNFSIGTGPYTYTNISVDIVKLKAVNPYWNGNVQTQEIYFKNYNVDDTGPVIEEEEDCAIADLQAGKTHLLEGAILRNLTIVQEAEGIDYYHLGTEVSWIMRINMNHPIIGTGENTPLKTPEAAKFIRQAINHLIPQQKIIDEFYLGCGFPGATLVSPLIRGFDESLKPYEYNITRAKELMEQAGYEYPLESSMTTTTTTTTESSTSTPSFEVIIVLAGMSSVSSLLTIIRRRRHKN